jgi:hypothetical protein
MGHFYGLYEKEGITTIPKNRWDFDYPYGPFD